MPDSIQLYPCPWVNGTRAVAYFGPISMEVFIKDSEVEDRMIDWKEAEDRLLYLLRAKAKALGANAVVGLEIVVDPFWVFEDGSSGVRLYATGTAAKLEGLF